MDTRVFIDSFWSDASPWGQLQWTHRGGEGAFGRRGRYKSGNWGEQGVLLALFHCCVHHACLDDCALVYFLLLTKQP